jgi:mRNA-degrading endonuclease YafQ of YafQ-DinJ toxin-antitoxin module
MPYFVFLKKSGNQEGLYKIAENENDLNNLNIIKDDYTIIEDSLTNFNWVKFREKIVTDYSDNQIFYTLSPMGFQDDYNKNREIIVGSGKKKLQDYIQIVKSQIKPFLDNNKNHPLFSKWNDYYNELSNLNLDNIQLPIYVSLERYLDNNNLISLNTLQIP